MDPTLFNAEHLMVRRRCEVCGVALSVRHTHTYVVQRQIWIKIGATSTPRRRINELRRPTWQKHIIYPRGMDWFAPLTQHLLVEGDAEHDLHVRFADHHVIGEWFQDCLEIRRWLREVDDAL